jgi:hypothetical protein
MPQPALTSGVFCTWASTKPSAAKPAIVESSSGMVWSTRPQGTKVPPNEPRTRPSTVSVAFCQGK